MPIADEPSSCPAAGRPSRLRDTVDGIWNNITLGWSHLGQDMQRNPTVRAALDRIAHQIAHHPVLTLAAVMLLVCAALPFIAFMLFAMATVMVTFTGFVLVEGTLITIASVLLFSFLGGVLVVAGFVAAIALFVYMGYTFACDVIWPTGSDAAGTTAPNGVRGFRVGGGCGGVGCAATKRSNCTRTSHRTGNVQEAEGT